jgi:hypothetical protein
VTPQPATWHRFDRHLARIRPYRQPLSLLAGAVTIAARWNLTCRIRLGFGRWTSPRRGYDPRVMLGVTGAYSRASARCWRNHA